MKSSRKIVGLLLLLVASRPLAYADDWSRDLVKDCGCSEKCCQLANPICPPCDPENTVNCAVVTENTDDGSGTTAGTLSYAIEQANTSCATAAHPFSIIFDLVSPGQPVGVEGRMPAIKKPVCINGFSQPGADECQRVIQVEIQVDEEIENLFVLEPTASGSTLKGLSIGGSQNTSIQVNASCICIKGNNFGVRKDGITPFFDASSPLHIEVLAGTCITIGGLEPQDKNVISNVEAGIIISATGVTVVGNFIGTDVSGTTPLNNGSGNGITIQEGNNNFIGCLSPAGRNLISAFSSNGIKIEQGHGNRIINCLIGTDINGKLVSGMANAGGVSIDQGSNTLISQSLISQNIRTNILIGNSSFNTIRDCLIGTDKAGNVAAGGLFSIQLTQSSNNLIERSLISVRGGVGVHVVNSCCNQIIDNIIGTDKRGQYSLGQNNGIILCSEECDTEESPISCLNNVDNGICASSFSTAGPGLKTPRGRLRRGRRQCVLACSTEACPDLAACAAALSSESSAKNHIKGNLISGNNCSGILLLGARKNIIEHNTIGTDSKEHCPVPNTFGVFFGIASESNQVLCNVIAGNSLYGVVVGQPSTGIQLNRIFSDTTPGLKKLYRQIEGVSFKNAILKNSIFCNGESGIVLIENGNRCIKEPTITSAIFDPNTNILHVEGEFDCTCFGGKNIIIELYGNVCCRKGIREGACFLGSQQIACPVTPIPDEEELVFVERLRGNKTRQCEECVSFEFDVCIPDFAFGCVTATATLVNPEECNSLEDTSPFSCPVPVLAAEVA